MENIFYRSLKNLSTEKMHNKKLSNFASSVVRLRKTPFGTFAKLVFWSISSILKSKFCKMAQLSIVSVSPAIVFFLEGTRENKFHIL